MKKRKFITPAYWLTASLMASLPAAAEPGYNTQTGHFIELELSSVENSRTHAANLTAPTARLRLFNHHQQIELQATSQYQHLSAFSGKSKAQKYGEVDEDIIMVSNARGGFMVLLPERQQMVYQPADGPQTLLTFTNNEAFSADAIALHSHTMPDHNQSRASNQADIDAEGNTIIDLLAGFSTASATLAIDPEAYAFAQVESINQALKNSQVEKIKIRLVGIQIIDEDYPIHSDNLSKLSSAFAEGMEKYSADLLAAFFIGDSKLDNAVGWAYTEGNITLNKITSTIVLRHEIGHNAGGDHCSSSTSKEYYHGWDNGKSQTIMCGNTTGYYSNPDLKDRYGLPLGDKQRADMARVWRENKARLSSYRPAIIPLNNEKAIILAEQKIDLNARNQYRAETIITVPQQAKKIVISALHGEKFIEDGKYTLEVRDIDGTLLAEKSGYYGSDTQYYPSLTIPQPKAGQQLQISLSSRSRELQDLLLRAWAFTDDLENGGAESGDLSGWKLIQGQFRVITSQDGILPAEGKYYFTARENDKAANYANADSMSQIVAINTSALTAASSARISFKSNGWGDGDYGTVTLWAMDKDGTVLNGQGVTTEGKKQQWIDYSIDLPLLTETAQIEIRVDAWPVAGSMNDVHFDDFRFEVKY